MILRLNHVPAVVTYLMRPRSESVERKKWILNRIV